MITIKDLYNIVGNKIANETGKAVARFLRVYRKNKR